MRKEDVRGNINDALDLLQSIVVEDLDKMSDEDKVKFKANLNKMLVKVAELKTIVEEDNK